MGASTKQNANLQTSNRVKGFSQPKRKKKKTLVFDEDSRRKFLGGFHTRKVQRRKRAEEELQRRFKEERRKIKQNARKQYEDLISSRDIPELEQLLSEKAYEIDGHSVSVLEIDVADLTEGDQWIGNNQSTNETTDLPQQSSVQNVQVKNDIEGMSLESKAIKESEVAVPCNSKANNKTVSKKLTKHTTLEQIKKSKSFQKKQRLESQRNKKRMRRFALQKERSMPNKKRPAGADKKRTKRK